MDEIANYIAIFLGISILVSVTIVLRRAATRVCYWTVFALVATMAIGAACEWIA
jgi:hypothetical protein